VAQLSEQARREAAAAASLLAKAELLARNLSALDGAHAPPLPLTLGLPAACSH
jgi:hypothetical protein